MIVTAPGSGQPGAVNYLSSCEHPETVLLYAALPLGIYLVISLLAAAKGWPAGRGTAVSRGATRRSGGAANPECGSAGGQPSTPRRGRSRGGAHGSW